jgi:two-component system, chemotaxis family, sensor kinase Cph1
MARKDDLQSKSERTRSEAKKSDPRLQDLRRKAEEKLKKIENEMGMVHDDRVQQLVHELHVHQAELEMQNEELRNAQEGLEKSRSRYSFLYDFAPIGYFTCDRQGIVLEINLTGAGQLIYERTMLVGKPFAIHFRNGGKQAFYDHLKKVFESGSKQSCEGIIQRKDGSHFNARLESMLSEHDGDVQCLTAVIDITELKTAEEKLKRSNAELEQFAYSASHDLREPLRTIASFLQLLEKRYRGRLDEKADEYIDFVVDSAHRMGKLLDDLVEFSRLDWKPGRMKAVDCSVALEKAIYDLGTAIEESGAQLTYDPLPTVVADESRISRLFQNLVANAIKFRGKGKSRIHVSAKKKENEWVFSVRDEGIGLDPKFAERIFVVFQRLHTREEYEGTGMGLAMCKKIVKLHGGRIWVESAPGQGATFYFTLPVMETPPKD